MGRWKIEMREVWVQSVVIDTDTLGEAVEKARGGEGEYKEHEYSHTLGTETWSAYSPDGEYIDMVSVSSAMT